jgi:hypothetical protein
MSLRWIGSFVASCGSLTPAGDPWAELHRPGSLGAHGERPRHRRRLEQRSSLVAAGRIRGVHEESTPHDVATARGIGAGAVVVASRGCRVKGP